MITYPGLNSSRILAGIVNSGLDNFVDRASLLIAKILESVRNFYFYDVNRILYDRGVLLYWCLKLDVRIILSYTGGYRNTCCA